MESTGQLVSYSFQQRPEARVVTEGVPIGVMAEAADGDGNPRHPLKLEAVRRPFGFLDDLVLETEGSTDHWGVRPTRASRLSNLGSERSGSIVGSNMR